jgi:hypothetical protein
MISTRIMMTGKLLEINFDPIYNSFSITPIFLIIVGLFFVIQSKTLSHSVRLKNENDLIV